MNRIEAFRELHRLDNPMFVMPNAWCEGSARLIEQLGYPGLGTTSAGIAYARGYRDSSPAMDDEMRFENISRIVHAVRIPVSADLENGFPKHQKVSPTTSFVLWRRDVLVLRWKTLLTIVIPTL